MAEGVLHGNQCSVSSCIHFGQYSILEAKTVMKQMGVSVRL